MKRLRWWLPLVAFLLAGNVGAQEKTFTITVTAGKHDYTNAPVTVPLSVPNAAAGLNLAELSGQELVGQLTEPGITTEAIPPAGKDLIRKDLHFVLPVLRAGTSATLTVKLVATVSSSDPTMFTWKKGKEGWYTELTLDSLTTGKSRPILRYMHRKYDDSTEQHRVLSYKVFHHVYDPEGKQFVTNGGQTDYPDDLKRKLTFPHHRGLMFAFNRITYGNGKKADIWHANPKGVHQSAEGVLSQSMGPVLGRHRVAVDWHGPDKAVFAKEEREVTVYNVPGGTLVEFASRLKTTNGPIKLDGDPQHAGFQFRARNDVADKTAKQTYYLRPDGKGKLDETRNWDPKTKKGPVNLPWNAMSFVLDGKRYTVAYLDKPTNPREARWSERDYGRFGNYFEYEVTKEHPLVVDYRIWLQDGEMTGPQVQALDTEFVTPPAVSVK
jgi:Methane oxygenase PmoA